MTFSLQKMQYNKFNGGNLRRHEDFCNNQRKEVIHEKPV